MIILKGHAILGPNTFDRFQWLGVESVTETSVHEYEYDLLASEECVVATIEVETFENWIGGRFCEIAKDNE